MRELVWMLSIYDLTYKEQSLFENYSSKGYSDLQIALLLADEHMTTKIIAIPDESWTKSRITQIKAEINKEISKSYGGLFEAMQDESVESAQIVAGAILGNVNAKLPTAVIDDLINSKRQIQGYGFKELFDLTSDNHARQLRIVVSSGVSQGLTSSQIAKEYGFKSSKLSRGQVVTNIFTTIGESRSEGRYVAYREMEKRGTIKGYRYDSTMDSKTTLHCRTLSDTVYYKPIDEISHLMNTHFHERSVFVPLHNYDKSKTKPSQFGEDINESYEKWYLRQDKTFWKSTLTNKKYNAFLANKYDVKSLMDINKFNGLDAIRDELMR